MRDWSPDIMELGNQMASMTPSAALELLDYLKVNYGIEPPNLPSRQEEKPPEQKAPEQSEFTIVLEAIADATKRIALIKTYREITGASLKDAMGAINGLPGVPIKVRENLPKEEANKIKSLLEDFGGKAKLQ